MSRYQLNYLAVHGVTETVDAASAEEAEELARRRLLFTEPGFTIAVCHDGVELTRVTQRPRAAPSEAHAR
jgi:hypothetical protein